MTPGIYMKVTWPRFNNPQERRCRVKCVVVGCVECDVRKKALHPTDTVVPRSTNAHHCEDIKVLVMLPIHGVSDVLVLSSLANVVQNVAGNKSCDIPVTPNLKSILLCDSIPLTSST